ncbi:bifunctional MaoC family dehydratase N-terminal/OB-fold nucleic acid binding domain-containing protein [Kutzneria chonburiensis]|uniref:Bifunctional MaoC family dehydratase N-terminal/OB-fold nucleic acid binding domain-containing protein n=1 Tax=Kutzneria chonburiensis TaxID=1483604 RepID=A0ABV6MPM7_9PSEU|nr:bifunctional MaoC family dehydratase N-terminal/OB-fold nucleic acid binding domain-containing protein [Kutzneria chonburiensis]
MNADEQILAAARELAARGECTPRTARDPVNEPMINNWTEALGDNSSAYPAVAPPAMIQVWTMGGLHPQRSDDDPLGRMMEVLDAAGYTSVVATNSDQTYHRLVKPGERLAVTSRLADVVGPKRTALGEGWFVTTHNIWRSGDEVVGEMLWSVLKFKPKPAVTASVPPLVSRDTAFFWDGTKTGELRIQKCSACGALRHPPGPMCPRCNALDPTYVVASGLGEVYSYVVHHHPQVPGKRTPFVIALVELEEGVRMLGELHDIDPEQVKIGLPVRVRYVPSGEFVLPAWEVR